MRWREALQPVAMQRVALLVPTDALRELLVRIADAGTVELDDITSDEGESGSPAADFLQRVQSVPDSAMLAPTAPDLDHCESRGRLDLVVGEAQLEHRAAQAVARGDVSALTGWMPSGEVAELADRLAPVGGAVVPLPRPQGSEPPTLLPQNAAAREFAPLVQTYGTVPYADVDPSLLAGIGYVLMFGMMFADAGQGALLVLTALGLWRGWFRRFPRFARLRRVWVFLLGAGLASTAFGLLYGEFFGPTGVVPVVWLEPLDHPITLLAAAVAVGAVMLAGAYAVGTLNRFREGGWRRAAYAPSGLAGAGLFLGIGAAGAAAYFHSSLFGLVGGVAIAAGLVIAYTGLFASAGGGAGGAVQAGVELFDMVVRLCSNLVSFARLAAFGLTHAALGKVVWDAATGSWHRGVGGMVGAVLIFAVGNALAFGLEGLVAAIQALRLEYYELFSRVFDVEGRPFTPWHVPLDRTEEPCLSG